MQKFLSWIIIPEHQCIHDIQHIRCYRSNRLSYPSYFLCKRWKSLRKGETMHRRFVKEFANYLLDSLYPDEVKKKIKGIVYNYEVRDAINARQAMYELVDAVRGYENIRG